ncbi:RluA family pseudouridine synthase [Candidatus Saccharibacteria bacterium]|nr:RluA family pseudouridine synthase [Candidatus Saccharibacteria bacterium]
MLQPESTGFIVDEEQVGVRLDQILADTLESRSRSQWQKLIASEQVFVDGEVAKSRYKVRLGDAITAVDIQVAKEEYELPIIYEDDDVVVVNKPIGLLVHAKDARNQENTVVDMLRDKLPKDDSNRPGVVHRLDRDTSGVMILAKNAETKTYLQKQFQNRSVNKTYLALVPGMIKETAGVIKWPIERNPKHPSIFRVGKNGKPSETKYSVIGTEGGNSLVRLEPKTGRTHQLRVHMAHFGHPIIGDRFYKGETAGRMMLHAAKLEISIAHNKRMTFEADCDFAKDTSE